MTKKEFKKFAKKTGKKILGSLRTCDNVKIEELVGDATFFVTFTHLTYDIVPTSSKFVQESIINLIEREIHSNRACFRIANKEERKALIKYITSHVYKESCLQDCYASVKKAFRFREEINRIKGFEKNKNGESLSTADGIIISTEIYADKLFTVSGCPTNGFKPIKIDKQDVVTMVSKFSDEKDFSARTNYLSRIFYDLDNAQEFAFKMNKLYKNENFPSD